MQVLIVGNGGREHALAWKIADSNHVTAVYCAPGNAGTAQLGTNVPILAEDVSAIVTFACDKYIDLVVIGPEVPLAMGLADRLRDKGIRVFGPCQAAAQLESDKAFAKHIMRQHAIPTAEGRIFTDYEAARTYIASRDEPLVVKATGLAAGKGVFVCQDPSEALLALERVMADRMFGDAGAAIVVEEMLEGQEASILALIDGRNIYVLESSQDHKRIGQGDTGPNTGGMGAYSPAPVVTPEIMSTIESQVLVPVVDAMLRAGTPYQGVLYAGLMLTSVGPRVLEFNVRFGDPETQAVLARLTSDLVEAMLATCDGTLDRIELTWDRRPSVCVVMSSEGYPGPYDKGHVISGLNEAASMPDTRVFHAGTALQDGKVVTDGGRVLSVTALGDTIADAQERAYKVVDAISWQGAYCRRDIAWRALS